MTHAMKAKKLLSDWGILSEVKKINNSPDVSGCVYSIVFDDNNYDNAIRIMKSGNVIVHKTEMYRYGDSE
jgi:hypothetical protein